MQSRYDFLVKIFLLLVPTSFILVVVVYPLLYNVVMAFHNKSGNFIGIYNFMRMLRDSHFSASIRSTMVYVIACVFIQIILGIGLALYVINQVRSMFLKYLVYLLFVIPLVVPQVASGIVFRLLYVPSYGALNRILGLLGFGEFGWLTNPRLALFSAVSVDTWQWLPFVFLVFYAGFQSIPLDVLESAKVDGASTWQIFREIQLPFIRPLILLVLIFRTSDSLRVFDHVMVLTQGGPGRATEFLSLYLYRIAFKFWDLNYAAVISLIILIFMSLLFSFLSRILRREAV
jgi:multiple sugar transport system permease protein